MAKEVRFQMGKDKIRKRLIKYTREAFSLIPRMEKPRILDIGCGTGDVAMEILRLWFCENPLNIYPRLKVE